MPEKYLLEADANRKFLRQMRDHLFRFGQRFPSPGGSSYYLGDDGKPWPEKGRETWITSRMLHVYSMGVLLGQSGSAALADAALKGLTGELYDTEHGGWYTGISAKGSILPGKQCYTHAFVILAASTAVCAKRPGAEKLLKMAEDIFEQYFWEDARGLACDLWTTDFAVCDSYRGLNANMHTAEAFLADADVTGKEEYRRRAGRIIEQVVAWALENGWRIPEHFTEEWEIDLDCGTEHPDDPFKPYGATPGHGMEWARLIAQWAVSVSDMDESARQFYLDASQSLYQRAMKDGWMADGALGFVYTTDWSGKPVIHDRMHWTLAEAVNTSAVLWRLTKDPSYAQDYRCFMEYLDTAVMDWKNQSWYHQLDRENNPQNTVWPGKPDLYHAVQATLIPYCPVGQSVAAAIGKTV